MLCAGANVIAILGKIGKKSQLMTTLDQKSEQILRVLSEDGRISNLALAERVGLSPSACLRRVQELERAGVIQGYRAVLNPAAMGSGLWPIWAWD